MFLGFILIVLSFYLAFKYVFLRKNVTHKEFSTGVTKNRYIIEHEKKMKDDNEYEEYLSWCKKYGELPLSKSGFDAYRINEWKFNEKIKKAME